MASPSVRSKSAGEGVGAGGGSSNVSVVMPASITAGDTLIVFICQDGLNLLEVGDSGFIYLGGGVHSLSQIAGGVFYKKADGTEDGATVGFHGTASLDFAYVAYAFQDTSDPYVTAPTLSSMAQGTDGTAEPPDCDPGVSKDYYWLAVAGCDYRTFNTYPDDMTLDRQNAGTSGMFNASAAGAGKQSTADSYDPTGSFELTSANEWVAWTVGIHPTGGTEVNLAGTISAAGQISGDLGIEYGEVEVTAATGILELYHPANDTWTDITKYLRSWTVSWGASGTQEQIRARTATFVLDNNDRRFEPAYEDGAMYGDITVGAGVYFNLQVTAESGTTVYPLFYGVAQAWRPTYSTPPARDAVCVLECCDPNLIITNDLCTVSLPAQTGDLSIHDLLAARKWTGNIYENLETGDSTLQAYSASRESILSIINRIVDSEGGWFYWQPGVRKITARFLNRTYLALQHAAETIYYLDDNDSNGQYTGIILGSDDDHLYTRAMLTRIDGTIQTYVATMAAAVGERTYTASNLLLASDNEVADRAMHLVQSRCRALFDLYCSQVRAILHPGQKVAHSVNALGLTQPFAPFVITHTPNTGSALTFNCRVVGGRISQNEPGELIDIIGYLVDTPVIGGDYWILQDAVKGVLDTTTILGW